MKKICLSVVGLFLTCFAAFAQDTTAYKPRKLTFEEASLVSSYYQQDGNNSAVTGGVGTERLTDIANTIDLKFIRYTRRDVKHTFQLEAGIDHYTSASSDKVDPATISSPSYSDTRIYPSLNWTAENEATGITLGGGVSFSTEYDYRSFGINALFAKKSKDRNGEFTARLQAYLDQVSIILPIELRTNPMPGDHDDDYPTKARNSYSGSFSYSQVVNPSLQVALIADLVYQQGYLGLPFHRVYFNSGKEAVETLPDTRLKIPLGVRANYFVGDKYIIRSFYRYYRDDWKLTAHTLQLETVAKLSPFFSVTPFYRYYNQSGTRYFAPINTHSFSQQFFTSNYDLSTFTAHFYGLGFRLTPDKGVLGWQRLSALELRYGHYDRSNGLSSNIVTLSLQVK